MTVRASPALHRRLQTSVVIAVLLSGSVAIAQQGSVLHLRSPSSPGDETFSVARPWYAWPAHFSGGVTFDYAKNLRRAEPETLLFDRQMVLHVGLAFSIREAVNLSLNVPFLVSETGLAPGLRASSTVGDPRISAMFQLAGDPSGPISASLGADVFLPVHVKDEGAAVRPKLVLSGSAGPMAWAFSGAYEHRPEVILSPRSDDGVDDGPKIQLGATAYFDSVPWGLTIGPEVVFDTLLVGSTSPFTREASSLEVLLGLHKRLWDDLVIGAAAGVAALDGASAPELRVLVRIAHAARPPPRPPAKTEERYLVLTEKGGHVGAVRIKRGRDVATIDQADTPLEFDSRGGLRTSTMSVSAQRQMVAKAQSMQPTRPKAVERYLMLTDDGEVGLHKKRGTAELPSASPGVINIEHEGKSLPIARVDTPLERGSDGRLWPTWTLTSSETQALLGPAIAALPRPPPPGCSDLIRAPLGASKTPGCPFALEQFLLVPDRAGKVGRMALSTERSAIELNQPYHSAVLDERGRLVRGTLPSGRLERFKAALAAQPRATVTIVLHFSEGVALVEGASDKVQRIVREVRRRPHARIEVAGHTDRVGPEAKNLDLSVRRAQRVTDLLLAAGLDPSRIVTVGRGEARPAAETDDEVYERRNRRVEVAVR